MSRRRGLPELSHLQYLALHILHQDERAPYVTFTAGQSLRQRLLARGAGDRSLTSFYLLMQRLTKDGYVMMKRDGRAASYRILKKGEGALTATRDFYLRYMPERTSP